MQKVFQKFPDLHSKLSLHLVEVSPALSEIQEKTLTGRVNNTQKGKKERQDGSTEDKSQENEVQNENTFSVECVTECHTCIFRNLAISVYACTLALCL